MKKYQALIDRAIAHIKSCQSPDGSFVNLSGTAPDDFSDGIPRQTTFFTANILACLQDISGEATDMCRRMANFLLSQKSTSWSFNYWARDASLKDRHPYPPYPDDLDDTFSALAALARYDPAIIAGGARAAIAKMLISLEVQEGGPYRTWLVAPAAAEKWKDVDVAVNATIGYFLSLIGVRLSPLKNFIDDAIYNDRMMSPYYPGLFHIGYFVSRYYEGREGAVEKKLVEIIVERLQENNGSMITPLERAMGILTLANLGHAGSEDVLRVSAELLAARIEREGFLPYAFCIDPARAGERSYAGSSALTAAFVAAALARDPSSIAPSSHLVTQQTMASHDHIRGMARSACRDIGDELRTAAEAQIGRTTDEKITSLAYEFRDVLYHRGVIIPPDVVEQLSLASLYGWMAYATYDDALDGDGDDSRSRIPCANFFLRELMEIYLSLGTRVPTIGHLFKNTMCRIDNANSWEQHHCRTESGRSGFLKAPPAFCGHGTLADRSIGYAMGPLAELLFAGYPASSEEYKKTELFFRHYLIARQLHDDAHDWEEDLLYGRLTSANTMTLAHFQKKYPARRMDPDSVIFASVEHLSALRKVFWEETIDELAGMIGTHIAAARRARQASRILEGADFMESTLRQLEAGARRAVAERDEAIIFLRDYSNKRN